MLEQPVHLMHLVYLVCSTVSGMQEKWITGGMVCAEEQQVHKDLQASCWLEAWTGHAL